MGEYKNKQIQLIRSEFGEIYFSLVCNIHIKTMWYVTLLLDWFVLACLFSRIVLRNWQQGKTSHLEGKRQIQRLKVDKRRFVFSSQHYYMKLSADWSIGRDSGRPALLYQAEISHRLDTWSSWGWLVVFYTSPNRQLGIFYDPTWQFRCELVQRELVMEFF